MSALKDAILTAPAHVLAAKIRAREVTSRAVVDAHITRIERTHPVINAVVAERFADARAEADAADATLQKNGADVGPLFGVPCTVKECFEVAGLPNSSGLVARKDKIATSDATCVKRLKDAGAIVLGVTNTSELCMWMESSNKVYGRTNNPYDPTRIVGGSSGGEGAVVGSGGSPFGLAADVGGSIRMPAFFNGVFGHKPSSGFIPNTGQHPIAENEAQRYLGTGPIARSAQDLPLLVDLLRGPDGEDPVCEARDFGDPRAISLQGLKVVSVVDDGGRTRVHPSLARAQERALAALAQRGAEIRQTRLPELKRALEIWAAMMSKNADTPFAELLGEGARVRLRKELPKTLLGKSDHMLPSIGLLFLEKVTAALGGEEKMAALGTELRARLEDTIGEGGVMLYPSYAEPAPKHGRPLMMPLKWVYTAVMNVMELPVTQVPLGLDKRGLPLGVQVVGRHGDDARTIAIAMALEDAFGGWVYPTSL